MEYNIIVKLFVCQTYIKMTKRKNWNNVTSSKPPSIIKSILSSIVTSVVPIYSPSFSNGSVYRSVSTSTVSSSSSSSTVLMFRYFATCAFAFSPIPAYLPQYWKLLSDKKKLSTTYFSPIKGNNNIEKNNQSIHIHTTTPDPEIGMNHNHNNNHYCQTNLSNDGKTGGFSPWTTLILVVSHMWRLLYFYGCVKLSTPQSVNNDNKNSGGESVEKLQWDLLLQSVVMIAMQFLLIHGFINSRSSPSYLEQKMIARTTTTTTTTIMRRMKLSLLMGYNILQNLWVWETFLPYCLFFSLFTLMSFITCQFGLFRLRRGGGLTGLYIIRNASVVLESFLPVPQLLQNYMSKSTEGLSIAMVMGWITGDSLKFIYYFFGSSDDGTTHRSIPPTFYWGCVVCLFLDIILLLQIIIWYPTKAFRRFMTSQRKINNNL